MTLRECIQHGENVLKNAGIEDYSSDVRVLAMYAFDMDYTGLLMQAFTELPEAKVRHFMRCVERRKEHYPCQYITGSQAFMGYVFQTAEQVLIPRPETEILVERALQMTEKIQPCHLLDVCCGSGCIGISYILKRREMGCENDCVTFVDISDAAIRLTKENCDKLDVRGNVIQSDLFEKIEGKYNVIASNPPYIRTGDIDALMDEVRVFEPKLALDGGASGLDFYDRIIRKAGNYLYDGGLLLFEIGYDQFEDIRGLLVDAGYTDIECIKDYAGLDRVVTAKWSNQ